MDLNLSASSAQASNIAVNQPTLTKTSSSLNDSSSLLALTSLLVQIIEQLVGQLQGSSQAVDGEVAPSGNSSDTIGTSQGGQSTAPSTASSSLTLPPLSVAPIPSLISNESSFGADANAGGSTSGSNGSSSSVLSVAPFNVSPIPSLLGGGSASQVSDSTSALAQTDFSASSIPSLTGDAALTPLISSSIAIPSLLGSVDSNAGTASSDGTHNPNNSHWK